MRPWSPVAQLLAASLVFVTFTGLTRPGRSQAPDKLQHGNSEAKRDIRPPAHFTHGNMQVLKRDDEVDLRLLQRDSRDFFDRARPLEAFPSTPAGSTWLDVQAGGLDRRSFRLRQDGGEFWIGHRSDSIPVPRDWLVPSGEAFAEEEGYVSSFHYDSLVTAFPVAPGLTGLHLSSYAIGSGSAQAAAGRDVFLLLMRDQGRTLPGLLDLGVTKSRGRVLGCWTARTHHFFLGDVNLDRRTDLGVLEEEIICTLPEDERPPGSYYRQGSIRWYVFGDRSWAREARYDGRLPRGYRRLPLIGLESTPVDFVKSALRGRDRRPH